MMLLLDIFRRDFIYRSSMHSFQLEYFCFIFFIATVYPVFVLTALYTVPNAPSPKVLIVLYFYIYFEKVSYMGTNKENSVY